LRAPGRGWPDPTERAGRATAAVSVFRRHAWAYVAAACTLIAANWFTGAPWWSFWPLAAWGVVLAVHYLVHKSRTVDESWVAERTADLHSKSYDAGHIDQIAADQEKK
jgi:2TM domain